MNNSVIIALLILASSCGNIKEEKPAAQAPQRMPVEGIVLKRDTADNFLRVTGNILPAEWVEIKAEIQGKLMTVDFPEGGPVKKGQVLARIDDREMRSKLDRARASLKTLSDKEARQKKLYDIKGISKEQYDQTLDELQSLAAEVEILEAQLSKATLTAPFNGMAGLKMVSEGNIVNPSQLITTISQTDVVRLDFHLPEQYAGLLSKNSKIVFTSGDDSSEYTASVSAIQPGLDPVNRTRMVRAYCDNKDEKLVAGSFANVRIPLSLKAGIMVPADALIPDAKGFRIVVADSGKVKFKKVVTGTRTESDVLIVSGVQEGDTVVTTGLMNLKPNTPVKVSVAGKEAVQ